MGKIMDMIYANSQCASIYYQVFDMTKKVEKNPQNSSVGTDKKESKMKYGQSMMDLTSFGDYMYVEMAHYTDDDTVVLICVSNTNNF